ncbi:MAG TPA: type II toxin-antitoxin system PemK/MazF family toxin [Verrucomicrobiaceae bacterium]|jgi:mRNA interferase MazF
MKRGAVFWVNLSGAHPPEMDKTRPAVVLSNSTLNARLGTVVVLPLSTQPGEIWPLRVPVAAGRRKASFAVIPGIRQVAKSRLLDMVCTLAPAELQKIEKALAEYLSD